VVNRSRVQGSGSQSAIDNPQSPIVNRQVVDMRRIARTIMVCGMVLFLVGSAWSQDEPEATGNPPYLPNAGSAPAEGQPTAEQPAPAPEQPPPLPAPAPQEPAPSAPAPPEEAAPEPEVAPAPPAPPPTRPMPVRPRPVRPSRLLERRAPQPGQPGQPQTNIPEDLLPKEGGKPEEPITFDFNDAPLDTVVRSIGRMTGRNFDVDPAIANTRVTVITHDKIPPEMAYEVLESLLTSRGFSLVETIPGHLTRIVQSVGGEGGEKVPLVKGIEGVPKSYDELSTHIVTVKYADAAELAGILKSLGSKAATVDAYARTNTLIMTDTADGLRRIFSFLEEVDIAGFDTEMEIFTLEYGRAQVLAQQIQEVLLGGGGGAPQQAGAQQGRRPVQPTRPVTRPTVPGQSQPMIVGNKEQVLRIVPDERLNSIIVVASPEMMERARDLVAKLDSPTPYEANNMNIYKLLNANAEDVEKALNAILGTTPRQGAEKAPAQSGEVQPFEKKVVVTRYERSNALLVLAAPQDYKLLREIIAQLDVPQRQVLVEAVIMDVGIQNNFGLTVDTGAVKGKDGFVMGNTSNISQLFNVADLATVLSSGTTSTATSLLAAQAAQNVLSLGSTGGITGGLYDNITVRVPEGTGTRLIKIPFVPFLLKALETLTDVDILSQPSLTTQDNESADIVVGQEIPVPMQRSGYSSSLNQQTGQQTTVPTYGLTSYGRGISREDVGVKMKVTPHINEGDYVSLETEIEVSKPITSSVGIDVNDLGPTFQKSKITNNVVVKDGSTGIIGGLMEETANRDRKQTPFLGSLPVVGWLFGTRNMARTKHNVVVLVTPYIIKEGIDLDRISKHKMDQFRQANIDVLFEKGIIKKIRKGAYMRNKYRPSIEWSNQMFGNQESFERGDIAR